MISPMRATLLASRLHASTSASRLPRIARTTNQLSSNLSQQSCSSKRLSTFITTDTSTPIVTASKITAKSELKPYYVTTPIFYVNADPHIGHLYSDIIADVLSRYHAYMDSGYSEVLRDGISIDSPDASLSSLFSTLPPVAPVMCTGTDEHGLKIQRVAETLNESPQTLCDRISLRFKQLADAANIKYTRFIRTTDSDHKFAVTHLWRTLREKGHIYKGKHEGWYAVSDEAFYPDSQLKKVVDKEGNEWMESVETGAKVEWSQEVNYKFRLSAFQQPLLKWLRENPTAIVPKQKYDQVVAEVESGLQDLSISRPRSRLSWGIPVPDDGEHCVYVWMDALTNYLTVTGYPNNNTTVQKQNAWPADCHVVGKDILRFHAIYWPAFLIAANLPLPKTILAHSHWTMGKAKMSKSRGNVANPFEAIDMFGLDTLRFFLMRVGGNFASDSDYNPTVLLEYHRKYLQGQLGNLVSRICAPKIHVKLNNLVKDPITGILTRPSAKELVQHLDEPTRELCLQLEKSLINLPDKVDGLMGDYELGKTIELVLEETIGSTNELLQKLQPWGENTHPVVVLESVVLVTEALRISALLLLPFMPGKMHELLDTLKVKHENRKSVMDLVVKDDEGRLISHVVQRGKAEGKPAPLFPKIEVET
ncbi:probable METHIONYL-TRNA SYNTHETASE, mitochondrial [Melanopsichium pennsylvanicum]|uniref:Probable methionine--tRNA ligase, mitochondrial n=2 Tax=Melanopsichium pennsylvanicum TaxID=63383 RepID=A0AAJ5C6J9_9BASI|nr:probable METHIONYL-TRNA SYNTHETASE, mitochondrial [Melanopsichium pennsylvanicum 4]SNX85618.1 probable METHIONYL-TRNA SYNTHETASE, mitochondrial [Melanopsichium pennsylvanicum]